MRLFSVASILLVIVATISTLEARAISLPPRHTLKSKGPELLVNCEHLISSADRPDLVERCLALIDAMLHLDLPTSPPIDHQTRRDARSPAPARSPPPPFNSDALGLGHHSPGDALGKLLTGLNEAPGGEEFTLLDANDKPLWPSHMSEGIQSRWQPMRGKRGQLSSFND